MKKIIYLCILYISFYNPVKADICTIVKQDIKKVKIIPFKKEKVDDYAYNNLVKLGNKIEHCLIDLIKNNSRMIEPRQAPPYQDFRVGDLAVFLLMVIKEKDLYDFLPKKQQLKIETQGIYAYFYFVKIPKNRDFIRQKFLTGIKGAEGGSVN